MPLLPRPLSRIIVYSCIQRLYNCCRKFSKLRITGWLLLALSFTKFNFGWSSGPPQTSLGAYDAPRDLVFDWEGISLPIYHPSEPSAPRYRRLWRRCSVLSVPINLLLESRIFRFNCWQPYGGSGRVGSNVWRVRTGWVQ